MTIGNDSGDGGTRDNTTTPFVPYKSSDGTFEDSPLQYDLTEDKLISSVTIEVPPASIQVGQVLQMSAAGTQPFFKSITSERTFNTPLQEFTSAGTGPAFNVELSAEEDLIVQPVFSTSIPLTGTFNTTSTADERIVEICFRTDPFATVTGVRLEFINQASGKVIYYFPSRDGWLNDIGEDLTADSFGIICLDLREAPIGLSEGAVTINNYKIDSGVLYGNPSNVPYLQVVRQLATFVETVDLNDYKQRQTIRSGVKEGFSVLSITSNTQIQITSDSGGEFEVYFNTDASIDNTDGFSIQVPDQVVDAIIDPIAKRFHVSVDSFGVIGTSENKTDTNDLTRVHLFTYTAIGGVIIPPALLADPYLSYTNRTLQGILNTDGVRVDNLTVSSQDNATLGLQSSTFNLIANANNWENDKINPHVITVPAINPLNWTYLVQTVTTPPAIGTSVLLDPANYDNGTPTPSPVGGGSQTSTVQLVMITPVKEFVILYGQERFSTFDDALLNARSTAFNLPPALFDAIEVARIVLNKNATDSANINECSIIDTSGGAGGSGEVPSDSVFFDVDFALKNSTDNSKVSKFDASKQPTTTTKSHKLPADNSELATVDLDEIISGLKSIPSNKLLITKVGSPTTRIEFVVSDNQTPGSINSYPLKPYASTLEVVRSQRVITADRILTTQDIVLNSVIFADSTGTINISIPDQNFDGPLNITVVALNTGTINIIPLGSTTINGSGDTVPISDDQFKILDFYHQDDETKDWNYDPENFRKLTDNLFNDGSFTIFDNLDNSKRAQFDAANIPTASTRTYQLPPRNGRLALEPYAWTMINPNKTTNGEVSYRNEGVGFQVFRTAVGTFSLESDGTVLEVLPTIWSVRRTTGGLATLTNDALIAGISGYSVTFEGWASGSSPNTGNNGSVTFTIRDSGGTLTDVTNTNSVIYIAYREI